MLGNVALTMLTLLLLLGVVAAGWARAPRGLDLSRRAARLWSASALIGMAALALMLTRGSAPDWVSVTLGHVLAVAALLAIRRGVLRFLRRPMQDTECIVTVAVFAAVQGACWLLPPPWDVSGQAITTCLALAWVLMRSSMQTYPGLRAEFGERNAFLLVSPQVAGVALFVLRAGAALLPPEAGSVQQPLPADTPLNVASALLILMLVLLLHGNLAVMVLLRLVRKLRHLSQRDALTGLYNRAEWNRQLDAQHRWLGRFGEPFGVLMIDIDHFKKINDRHGHPMGDRVIKSLALFLKQRLRKTDFIGRYGGEEFAIVMPNTALHAAHKVLDEIRRRFAEILYPAQPQDLRCTFSAGVVQLDEGLDALTMASAADEALYRAKHAGRNCVVRVEP